ncbi:MFS transporter [Rathayibacter sp. VKM Ac-2857]|uniref:MFS transporter n=1 Tax=Rathayibacter sp. VKM Ac-2857 TaxID=2739020 RepID=UPI0015665E24|nr:MFS transporter [Rathayibacter sp. VKM Ac-2857]NQX16631.1 MFS transporter [Rathayibacter sp. VKM Ac-2857]
MNDQDAQHPLPSGGAFPIPGALAPEDAAQQKAAADLGSAPEPPKVSAGWITLLALGLFGAYLAFVTPIAISLAIQVQALAPGNEEYLGILLGVGSLAALLVGPLGGQLSDRTRTRLGRRRPWILIGTLVGLVGLTLMAAAPNVLVLGIGWVIAQIGWSQTVNNFTTLQADKLPESQRGKVGAITGFATMVAPVFGAVIGGTLASQPFLLFLVPGAIALVLVLVFVAFMKEDDSRNAPTEQTLTAGIVLSKYVFNPRKYPDFSWNWLGRFFFFFGLTLNTSYTAFFFSSRLDIPVDEIGGTVATVGLLGIVGTIIGVFAGGFLSDKLRRRKAFVLGSGILFAAGSLVMLLANDLPLLIVGAFMGNLAIGVFSAVDQALFLDVLPERATEAGRFVNLTQFATTIPQALAPLLASVILAIGAGSDGARDYSMLYILAAVFTLLGGLVVLRVRSVR